MEYFNNGIPQKKDVQTSPLFKTLNLRSYEVDDLVNFLENGLYDPNLDRYVPDDFK